MIHFQIKICKKSIDLKLCSFLTKHSFESFGIYWKLLNRSIDERRMMSKHITIRKLISISNKSKYVTQCKYTTVNSKYPRNISFTFFKYEPHDERHCAVNDSMVYHFTLNLSFIRSNTRMIETFKYPNSTSTRSSLIGRCC